MSKIDLFKCDICGIEHRTEDLAEIRLVYADHVLDKIYSDICAQCEKDISDILNKLANHE